MIKHFLRSWVYVAGLALAVSAGFGQGTGTAPAKSQGKAKTGGKVAPANPVDLNTATEAELVSVPGIGAPTAKKIIAGRPYGSVADLSKAGISPQSIKAISPMVKVSGGAKPQSTGTIKMTPSITPAPPAKPTPTAAKAAAATASSPGLPGGGPGIVWVNLETKVYHQSGDKWYGKTKKGKYMKEGDAQAAGYRAAKSEK